MRQQILDSSMCYMWYIWCMWHMWYTWYMYMWFCNTYWTEAEHTTKQSDLRNKQLSGDHNRRPYTCYIYEQPVKHVVIINLRMEPTILSLWILIAILNISEYWLQFEYLWILIAILKISGCETNWCLYACQPPAQWNKTILSYFDFYNRTFQMICKPVTGRCMTLMGTPLSSLLIRSESSSG